MKSSDVRGPSVVSAMLSMLEFDKYNIFNFVRPSNTDELSAKDVE